MHIAAGSGLCVLQELLSTLISAHQVRRKEITSNSDRHDAI